MIDDLNAVSAPLLQEAASLSGPEAMKSLLMRHTAPECWAYLDPFVEDVVLGGEPAAGWRRGQVLVPDVSLADQLRLSPAELLAPLGGGFSARVTPWFDDWRSGVSWVGAPALRLPEATYRSAIPGRAVGLGAAETEAVRDPAVALRRWIAARLARSARPTALTSLESLAGSIPGIPPIAEWSRDAVIAGGGLLREHRELGAEPATIPGMRGPDVWYQG